MKHEYATENTEKIALVAASQNGMFGKATGSDRSELGFAEKG